MVYGIVILPFLATKVQTTLVFGGASHVIVVEKDLLVDFDWPMVCEELVVAEVLSEASTPILGTLALNVVPTVRETPSVYEKLLVSATDFVIVV